MAFIIRAFALLPLLLTFSATNSAEDANSGNAAASPLRQQNLVAWCIVPFDAAQRGPAERAQMLQGLEIQKCAYDWRQQHVATFEQEILEYRKRNIEFFAFWDVHEKAYRLFKKHGLRPQIWKMAGKPGDGTQQEKIAKCVNSLLPHVKRTKQLGFKLGIYNHGGWQGEPANMVAICQSLHAQGHNHVGIVYNFHHGHEHIDHWADSFALMKPYLHCLNLNGMNAQPRPKILGLSKGAHEKEMIHTVLESGYQGPIGILDHRSNLDSHDSLLENLEGLKWIQKELDSPGSGGPKPADPKLYKNEEAKALVSTISGQGRVVPGNDAFRQPPLTMECRVTLTSNRTYNILAACDTKVSANHWEVFTMPGTGRLTAFLPGYQPDHVRSEAVITDGRSHSVTMTFGSDRVQLYVDGQLTADQKITRRRHDGKPGAFAIGRLIEGKLQHQGKIDWLRLSTGLRPVSSEPPAKVSVDPQTVGLWTFSPYKSHVTAAKNAGPLHDHSMHDHSASNARATSKPIPYSAAFVKEIIAESTSHGDAVRGAKVFAGAKSACLSCHRVGQHGGTVGPDLSKIARKGDIVHIVESLFWPDRKVRPEYVVWQVVTTEGKVVSGYRVDESSDSVTLRDPATAKNTVVPKSSIDEEISGTTPMPAGLTTVMTRQQQRDVVRFLSELGAGDKPVSKELTETLKHASMHGPASFDMKAAPIAPKRWPHSEHPVNRARVYDFYTKQAEYFRQQSVLPMMAEAFPGLDGGKIGHWGTQVEETWRDGRWNNTDIGHVQAGVVFGDGLVVARGLCVRLGDQQELSACFNPDTLTYDAAWAGGFVSFSSTRHGFVGGLRIQGKLQQKPTFKAPEAPFQYRGYYRHGNRIVFSYRIGDVDYLDSPWAKDGKLIREFAPQEQHSLRHVVEGGPTAWPQVLETEIIPGTGHAFAIDTIELPYDNPWKALLFCSGHDFLPDGSALVCTMQGDVWHVSGLETDPQQPGVAKWKRFAAGLSHPLGLLIAEDSIFVQCRDQLTRLTDTNEDGEADFYECFSNAFETSSSGHDFICGLERDPNGNFYTSSGNQGLVRISADGRTANAVATGFRNADGLGILSDGTVTVPCSEGDWTPASMICAVRDAGILNEGSSPPHFGYRGPINNKPPELPLAYLPRALDNSSGGQIEVPKGTWGPLSEKLLHLSFGMGSWFTVLQDEVDGQMQGAVVRMTGDFRSGIHRGRFNPKDGQLYVTGMDGWGSYTPDDGCFQRIRRTTQQVQLPTDFHLHENGVQITFSMPVDSETVSATTNHFAQCWNYRYSGAYGSPEYSPMHPGTPGHDPLAIASAHVLPDGKSVFLEIPSLQPVSQLHLRLHVNPDNAGPTTSPSGTGHDLFVTAHKLDAPFESFPGYTPVRKTIAAHPLLADMALNANRIPNPWRSEIDRARRIELGTGPNLTYETKRIRVKAGEAIAFTLSNPDAVPHNWALVRPGTLQRVGELANRLISDPTAFAKHYIPETDDVLQYTDIVGPGKSQTIYFHCPSVPGRYPFLCTFPGHWMVMNGELIVTK